MSILVPPKYKAVQQDLKNQPKTWLITGVAGYVGSNLAETLLKLGQRVVGLDDFSSSVYDPPQPSAMYKAFGRKPDVDTDLEIYPGDICDPETWWNIEQFDGEIDYVVHLAAKRSVPLSFQSPAEYYRTNVYGTMLTYDYAMKHGAKSFVYASSSSVYGGALNPGHVLTEEDDTFPNNPYADSKLATDNAMHWMDYESLPSFGLRFFNIYGPEQHGTKDNSTVIPIWMHQLKNGYRPCAFGSVDITRDFVHVWDVVQAIILAAVRQNPLISTFCYNEVFNIGSGNSYSLRELFVKLRDNLHILYPEKVRGDEELDVTMKPRIGDVKHTRTSLWKAKTYLGYEPQFPTLDDGLSNVMGINISRMFFG